MPTHRRGCGRWMAISKGLSARLGRCGVPNHSWRRSTSTRFVVVGPFSRTFNTSFIPVAVRRIHLETFRARGSLMRKSSACAPCSSFSRALQSRSLGSPLVWLVYTLAPSLDFLISLFDKRVFRNEAALPGLWFADNRFFGDSFENPGRLRHRLSMLSRYPHGAPAERPSQIF